MTASTDPAAQSPASTLARRSPFCAPTEPRGRCHASLEGSVPEWLRGTLLRTAPALGAPTPWAPKHLFDGLALSFGFELGGHDVPMTWAMVDSDLARAAQTGEVPFLMFGT